MVNESNTLAEIQEFFANDRFATTNGCTIVECRAGHAVVEMPITPEVMNAMGSVMGGAVFTLGDFALAVASNLDDNPSVSIDVNIRFLTKAQGTKLIATCDADRAGRTVGFYTVNVDDDLGRHVAILNATLNRQGGTK